MKQSCVIILFQFYFRLSCADSLTNTINICSGAHKCCRVSQSHYGLSCKRHSNWLLQQIVVQWRFYVGARGLSPPNLAQAPKF